MAVPQTLDTLDVGAIRKDFPILKREIHEGVPLVYLDSAASSQKPEQVIRAMSRFYETEYANVHRGIYTLAEEATAAFESARERVGEFVGAESSRQIIFTRNATEAINLVSNSWGRANLGEGDLVLLTEMEHHSNIVPWQMLASELGFKIEYAPITDDHRIDLDSYGDLLERQPKLVGFTQMSNVLGTINPVAEMAEMAHAAGAVVLVDGAQSVPHMVVNVAELDIDFLAFSAHKMCGPSGIGALYGRRELLEEMPPFMGGGEMIKRVQFDAFSVTELPSKFEAGTPPIAQAVGFGAAVDYLSKLGMRAIRQHEQEIIKRALEQLEEVPGVRVLGPAAEHKGGVAAFTFADAHPHDVAQILDRRGVAVRAGHHCAMPLHEKLGLPATTRASFYLYNTPEDIDSLIEGLYAVREVFA
ncbi:MAG: cysteine desulfurase [Anaerolineae bacterium]|nr:MAG: cysteine desulfurase [Anaerolineae bacterium]